MIRCHKCGFSNQPSAMVCIKCKTVLSKEEVAMHEGFVHPNKKTIAIMNNNESPWDQQKPVEAQRSFLEVGAQTIRRVVPVPEKKSCSLIALSVDEKKELRKIDLEGDTVSLDRAKLDPSNSSISRNGHASIKLKDGKWYIENTSALKTTFVQVNKPMMLSEGDVVLIGDSLFRFKED